MYDFKILYYAADDKSWKRATALQSTKEYHRMFQEWRMFVGDPLQQRPVWDLS